MDACSEPARGQSITSEVMGRMPRRCYLFAMTSTALPMQSGVGDLVREWRQRRRLSQLELAGEADISTRHLSFVENGRSVPSRSMLLRLAERLDMPLRARNEMLHAAGFAALYSERPLDAPEMSVARRTVDAVLDAHAPFPALAVDRHWTLVASNAAVAPLLAGVPAALLQGPVNVLRLSLHPDGLASRIENLAEWRAHLLARLQQQIDRSGDARLAALHAELAAYPTRAGDARAHDFGGIAVPLRLHLDGQREPLSLISTTTVFGTPVDVTLSELALECFYPADERTRAALQAAARR
jgi:transcriptional regulator with XRE-family HTH domain